MAGKPRKPAAKPKAKSSSKGPNIFVILDDEEQRSDTTKKLKSAGFTVHSYFTAREFLLDPVDKTGGVVFAGYRLREMNGIELVKRLKDDRINARLILVVGHADVPKAVKGKVYDLIVHPAEAELYVAAIERSLHGEEFTERELELAFKRLTAREHEVVDAICEGGSSREIALAMGVSTKTIEAHRARIMDKTRANDVGELIRLRMAWK